MFPTFGNANKGLTIRIDAKANNLPNKYIFFLILRFSLKGKSPMVLFDKDFLFSRNRKCAKNRAERWKFIETIYRIILVNAIFSMLYVAWHK